MAVIYAVMIYVVIPAYFWSGPSVGKSLQFNPLLFMVIVTAV